MVVFIASLWDPNDAQNAEEHLRILPALSNLIALYHQESCQAHHLTHLKLVFQYYLDEH